jgi:CheY-like chemotaxis protein
MQESVFVTNAEPPTEPVSPIDPSEALRILVIEDDRNAARALCKLITRRIPLSECRVANNLADGIRMCQENEHDLTLLDIQLPLSADDETIDIDQTVQSIPKMPPPVIVVTQMDDPSGVLMEYCFAYGAENFFSKDHLLRIVETWDGEMKVRQIISSIASAYMRSKMPARRHLYEGGIKHLMM